VKPEAPRADHVLTMRTLGFRSHVLLALAAAVGLVATLGRPWYAAAPAPGEAAGVGDLDGPLRDFSGAVQRWFGGEAGMTGWDSLGNAGLALAAMAGVAAVGGLACLAPPLQALGRDLLRYGALAAFGIAAWKLLDSPGPNALMELRHGALAAAGCAAVLLTCGMSVANAPLRNASSARRPRPAGGPADRAGSPRPARSARP